MAMFVAFASSDQQIINAHFGWTPFLEIYKVDQDGYSLHQSISFPPAQEDGDEDKLTPRINAVRACTLVYVSAIGGSAAAKLINHKITPIRSSNGEEPITDLLDRLVIMPRGTPPPWLRKVLLAQS
jgi:nitrogen fixation protein NifX